MLLTKDLSLEIQNLYDSTPDSITMTALGKKTTSGIKTDELCIVFGVEKKIPSNQLSGAYVVPKIIEINNQIYKTDVVETESVEALGACYNWTGGTPPCTSLNGGAQNIANCPTEIRNHRSRHRPLKGGIVISADPFQFLGTLGLICVDNDTQSLVGLTNAHVGINIPQCIIPEDSKDVNKNSYSITGKRVVQYDESQGIFSNFTNDIIGNIHKYFPLKSGNYRNYIDAATFSIRKCAQNGTGLIDNLESFKQLGIPYNTPMSFATTSEINNLLNNNIPLYSAGRTTGPKGLTNCRLRVNSMAVNLPVSYQGIIIQFYDTIEFRYEDNANYPSFRGDSGSIVIGDFSGTFKIVGLLFAGSINYGYFCRIDDIADKLGLSAWDGTSKNFLLYPPRFLTTKLSDLYNDVSNNDSWYWNIKKNNNYYFGGFIHVDQISGLSNRLISDTGILPCISSSSVSSLPPSPPPPQYYYVDYNAYLSTQSQTTTCQINSSWPIRTIPQNAVFKIPNSMLSNAYLEAVTPPLASSHIGFNNPIISSDAGGLKISFIGPLITRGSSNQILYIPSTYLKGLPETGYLDDGSPIYLIQNSSQKYAPIGACGALLPRSGICVTCNAI